GQRGRPEPGAPRPAALVGEVHLCDHPRVAGSCDKRCEVGEHEFGPAEHREGSDLVDVTPREVDKSGARLALHRCAAEIQCTLASDNLDRDRPRRRLRVAAYQFAWLLAYLNADVDVVVVLVSGLPDAARQVVTLDLQQHRHRPYGMIDVVISRGASIVDELEWRGLIAQST